MADIDAIGVLFFIICYLFYNSGTIIILFLDKGAFCLFFTPLCTQSLTTIGSVVMSSKRDSQINLFIIRNNNNILTHLY